MMKVNVLINTNKFTLDEIDPCDTVESIKDNIYDKLIKHKDVSAPNPDNPNAHTYITTNHLRLLYKGKQLPKLSTLQEHGFKSDDTLLLFVSQKQQEDPQDDINEIIHSTMDNPNNGLKYTLTIKNDHQLTNPGARDAEMMEILEENQLKALLARIPFEVPKDSIHTPPAFDREIALPTKAKKNKTTFPPTTEGTHDAGSSSALPAVRVLPLTVESFSPVNKIFFESPVRVKFSQPMIPIGEFDKLQASFPIPVSLSPSVAGEWRWVDPFTVTFTPNKEQGYPKSTTFTCVVKGNLSSAVGGTMRDLVEWSFSSASLNFENRSVSFSGKRIQVFVQFNQPIIVDKVFKALVATTEDEEILDCNLLDSEKKEDLHFTIQKAVERAKPNTFLIFEIEDDINGVGKSDSLPVEVEVYLNPFVLDLEKKLSFKFKTVAALKVKPIKKTDLKGKPIVWSMSSSIIVQFTNSLLAETTQEQLRSYVTVVPKIPDMKLSIMGDALYIAGQKLPGDYKVTLHTTIMDMYGQNLGEEVIVEFPVSAPTTPFLDFAKSPGYMDFNSSSFVTLDPSLPPVVHFTTRNVRELMVVAYSVSPMQHHRKFLEFSNARDKTFPNFLHEVWRKTIEVTPPLQNENNNNNNNNEGIRAWYKDARSTIDLSKAFGCDDLKICGKNKESQLVVVVNAIDTVEFTPQAFCKKFWITWSDVGISYLADEDTIYGWSYSLLTGEMLNCNMYLCDSEGETLPLEKPKDKEEVGAGFVKATATESLDFRFLAAEIGNRSALVGVANIFRSVSREKYVWHIVDDRANFRPFDRVHIKGIIRERTSSGRLIVPKDADTQLTYSVYDSRNKVAIKATVVDIKPSFCFDFDFEVPGSINLGQTYVNISFGDTKMMHTINVQEYKRKAFDMVMTRDKPTLRSQEPLRLTSYAQAFTGEVLSGTSATWSVKVSPAQYTPPKLGVYNFGAKSGGGGDDISLSNRYTWESPKNYSGKHNLAVALDHITGPAVLGVSCTVVDSNTNEELSANESVVVHPTDVYVGIRAEQQFINFGEAYKFFAVTCDPSGNFTGNCALHMYVRGTPFETYDGGEHAPPDVAVVDVPLTPSEEGPIEFSFEPKFRGKHSVTLVSTDLNGRTSSTDADFWVYGAQSEAEKEYQEIKKKEKEAVKPVEPPPHYKGQVDNLELVLDNKSNTYVSGSKAELLIVSPFWPAQGALHIHKNGTVIKAEKFDVTDAMTRLNIDILEEYLPGVYVEVGLVGISSREAPKTETKSDPTAEPTTKKAKTDNSELSDLKKPCAAKGSIKITVSHEHKKLSLSVSPAATTYLPGGEASVDIDVVDQEGKPVEGAEVTLVVVDEAVLALTGYSLKDPRAHFYSAGQSHTTRNFTMNSIMFTRLLPKDALPVLPSVAESSEVITISYFNGRVLRFTLDNSTPVSQLKALIQERDGLPPATQRLLYNGKQLTDEGTLQDQGVPNGASINLVLRLFGGGLSDDKVMPEEAPPPIRIRTNMNALAFFGPHLTTQKNGKLTTKFTLPDSLTRYRVMAMANTIDQFGAGDSSLVVCLPLMVKQSPPRFLNFGDSCTVPVVVQNETNEEKEVVIGIRSVGDEVEIENPGWKFKIAPRGRTSVPFNVKPKGPGSAIFHVAASDSSLTSADAVQFTFPVQAPFTTEVFANSGFVDGDNVIQQPIAQFTNDSVVDSVGGMQVSLASTVFQELTDAALYVINYPYLCTEQLGSRLISLVAFKDMLPLLHKVKRSKKDPVPTPENLKASVKEIITSLVDRKDSLGNFGYWEKNGKSYDYASVFTYHALSFARENNFEVPPSAIASGKTFLRNIINKYEAAADKDPEEEKKKPSSYTRANVSRWLRSMKNEPSAANADRKESNSANHALACYAVYVLSLLDPSAVRRQEALSMLNRKKLENTPIEQIAWLLPSILEGKQLKINLKAVYEHINNSIIQTGQTAHFGNSNNDNDLFFRSDVRHNAVALHVLLQADPKHNVIPKLMRGLLEVRKNGLWLNTQDNAFSLLAINKFEKDGGMFIADLWIGKGKAAHTEFDGVSTDTHVTVVPMNYLIAEKDSTVTLAKKGQGRLYYRIAVEYSPKALFLPPRDSGFKITRTYEAVNDKNDVENSTDESGRKIVTIKAGAKVQIKVVMVAESVRSYVALVDHLPGGLEPQNVNAKRTGTFTGLSFVYRFWDHQNIRDSRVEVFVDLLYPGFVKAMTKGSFVVPPAKAEEMYSPDVYGRSDMMIVNVK